jgi:hypothetical protein
MEKLIHQYLDYNYYLYDLNGHDCIYSLGNETSEILVDLTSIYCLEIVECKLFVYTWAIKYKQDVDLSSFWFVKETEYLELIKPKQWSSRGNLEGLMFPMVQRVMARTIGLDLVSVQPMSPPTGTLFYMDMAFEPRPGISGRYTGKKLTYYQIFDNKKRQVYKKTKIFIEKIQKDIRKYLHVSNYNTTFVTQLE